MSDKTGIEWTDSTWNPVRGCSRVSPGCGGPNHEGGCYAEKIAARFSDPGQPFHGFAERTPHGGRWTGKVALVEEALPLPLRWRKPRRIFVNSMSDLFHESLPDEAIDKVFAVMALAPQHTFQVLTKRAQRTRDYLQGVLNDGALGINRFGLTALWTGLCGPAGPVPSWPLPNVWLGVSVERQQEAEERIPLLLDTPAAVRFLSCEPLLGPIKVRNHLMQGSDPGRCANCGHGHGFIRCPNYGGIAPTSDKGRGCTSFRRANFAIGWVIVGGESGPGARPMHPDWARGLRDQCQVAGVPFFFKQWGEFGPNVLGWSDAYPYERLGKKRAGRLLDGREWNEFPGIPQAHPGNYSPISRVLP